MNGSDWERIEAVLDGALELDGAALDAYLDDACGEDSALRGEVESLLRADRDAPAFLDDSAAALIAVPDGPGEPAPFDGRRVGAFRILREIGRGGMSTVYLAERTDGTFEQNVAIKVLQRDATSDETLRRFRMERRILASLDHPGIVRIQDGGVVDGRPYLVMEYVEGERIDRWCDAQRLTVRKRLHLFRQVLDAVASAHRSLVVHRDLKPDNILVDGTGRVRLLDFGIAKLLDAAEDAGTPTRTGLRPMTPEYAAPEQVRGEPITTACDTYALGVLLYEMLTGHRPYAIDTASPFAVERAICESEPERPSSVILRTTETKRTGRVTPEGVSEARGTDPPVLQRTLDGDLDAILMKALRKEPHERYGSADAFADDVDRFLQARPVLARQGTRVYRLRKFARRHSVGVAMSAAGAIVLVAAFIAITASRAEAERARDRAETEAETSRAVTAFLVSVFGGSDPTRTLGDTLRARDLLERGRARVDEELADQPVVRASLLQALGEVYTSLGRHETADTLLQEAAALRVEMFGEDDPAVAESFAAIGINRNHERDFAGAADAFSRALAIRARHSEDSAWVATLAYLGNALRETGSADSSAVLYQRAIDARRTAQDTADQGFYNLMIGLAVTRRAQEDYAAAERIYGDVVPRQRALLGPHHPDVALSLNNQAYLLTRMERWSDAVPLYRESVAIHEAVFGPTHLRTLLALNNLAGALARSGQDSDAVAVMRDRTQRAEREWPDGHWRVGSAYGALGQLLLRMDRTAEAEASFRTTVESYRQTIGPNHAWTLVAETWTVLSMYLQGDEDALAALDRAAIFLQPARLDGDTRVDLGRIAQYLEDAGQTERAATFRSLLEG